MIENKTFGTFHKSSGAQMDWMFTLDMRWEPPLFATCRNTNKRSHAQRRRAWCLGLCTKGEKTEKCHGIWVLLTGPATRVRTQFIWLPRVCFFISYFYSYTHLGFAELGTRTFNINAIPGQSEEWLSVFIELRWSMSSSEDALKWSHTTKSHIQTISHAVS